MTFQEMISGNLKTSDIILTEEELMESFGFSVSPVVAFFTFKRKALHFLANNPLTAPINAIKKAGKKGAAKGLIATEKLKAEVESKGKKKNDTVYRYTKEQKDFLIEIYSKYGKQIIKEIEKFRKNILAPYQLIKRLIKENRSLTNKEINGMNYEEYQKYRESGRKKIEAKPGFNKNFNDKNLQLNIARDGYQAAIKSLEDFESGKEPRNSDTEKVLKLLGYDTKEYGGYSVLDFQRTDKIIAKYERWIQDAIEDKDVNVKDDTNATIGTISDVRRTINTLRKQGALKRSETPEKETKTEKNVSFARAYINWQLRKSTRDKLRNEFGRKEYINYYQKVFQDAIKQAKEKKDELLKEFIGIRGSIELNSFEKKIWGQKLTRKSDESDEISNWYLKLKDEDFQGKEKKFAIPDSVRKAEDTVNRETKRFERRLKEIMSEDEVKELKRLRLINNLITVKEMKDPDSLFKKPEEYSSEDETEKNIEDEPEEENNETTDEEFKTKLNDFINTKYDSIMELNAAKEKLRKLIKETDDEIVKKYNNEISNFLDKLNIKPKASEKQAQTDLIDINDVQNKINELLGKKYSSADEIREEQTKLNQMITRYKEQD
ncbi:MAG: GntR family transcriptional regulator, partial [Elusimicrobiota bacterium]|nr:GntR family transcriptional regulator [Elusimicrobiota bacterium]